MIIFKSSAQKLVDSNVTKAYLINLNLIVEFWRTKIGKAFFFTAAIALAELSHAGIL